MNDNNFSWYRLGALIVKEILYFRRDRIVLLSLLVFPLMQIILFSLVINNDPKHLDTAIINFDPSPLTRTIIQSFKNTDYFDITEQAKTEKEAENLLQSGKVVFLITIPEHFSRTLIRGDRPTMLLQADGINPLVVSNAIATIKDLEGSVLQDQLTGPLGFLKQPKNSQPFDINIEQKYNPAHLIQYSSVPGVIGLIMNLSYMMVTLVAITREKEQGTMENLLATPAQPIEVMLSKVIPYFFVGTSQYFIMIMIARWGFGVPINGSLLLIMIVSMIFLISSLLTGMLFSAVANTLYAALQLASYFLLPNVLFSGFVFPFQGMPIWGQWIGNLLPLTHYLRIIKNIMIKGAGMSNIIQDLWPILVFTGLLMILLKMFYTKTLD